MPHSPAGKKPDKIPVEVPEAQAQSNITSDYRAAQPETLGLYEVVGGVEFLAPAQGPDEIGRLGPFRVLGVLGRGGMGMVFRAEDPNLKRQLALKVMLPKFAADGRARARFLREARSQAAIEHEHVIVIHQVGEDRGIPYLAMPLLRGYTLAALLKAIRPPLKEALRIGREIAEGLAAAHAQRLIHRDIKPNNIWLEGRGRRVKILDFGLARTVAGDEPADGSVTQEGAVVGTPAYMSPEQARGENVDSCTDLFSLGIVLYQLVTGELPFQARSTAGYAVAICTHEPVAPVEKSADLPPALSDLILGLLVKDPSQRKPSTAEGVAQALRGIEEMLPAGGKVSGIDHLSVGGSRDQKSQETASPDLTARKSRPSQRIPSGSSRRRIMFIAGGLGAALVIATIFYALKQKPRDDKPAEQASNPGETVRDSAGEQTPTPVPGPKPGDVRKFPIAPGVVMEFCWIPAGEAQLGSPASEQDYLNKTFYKGKRDEILDGETEQQRGRFKTDGFWLGKYTVTQAEWQAVMGDNPSYFQRDGEGKVKLQEDKILDTSRFPVENVSWNMICKPVGFLDKLNQKEGIEKVFGKYGRFVLPHENEWEYACRGGKGNNRPFFFGNELNGKQANCDGQWSPYGDTIKGQSLGRPCAVDFTNNGKYEPHPWGLRHMCGNVLQWCNNKPEQDSLRRVIRGGAYNLPPHVCRSACRGKSEPEKFREFLGFRVCIRQD